MVKLVAKRKSKPRRESLRDAIWYKSVGHGCIECDPWSMDGLCVYVYELIDLLEQFGIDLEDVREYHQK